ncbi:MAG: CPBP family intramembrane metalloprotease, partial [Dehalococcoidia bacterium]|nr:CPBP family intramembrane metalloprotease [Dehalococcoidia bacterium]
QLALGWVVVTGAWIAAPSDWPFALAFGLPLATFVMIGVYEEALSRGYQLKNLAEGFGGLGWGPRGALLAAYLVSAAIFGALHATNPNATLISTLTIALAGVLLGAGMVLTGRLAIGVGLHITWNLFQGNVFGFPVSGASVSRTSVLTIEQTGPAIWTGGAFGPEGGLIGIVAIGVGVIAILGWAQWREGAIRLQTDLARYRPCDGVETPDDATAMVVAARRAPKPPTAR